MEINWFPFVGQYWSMAQICAQTFHPSLRLTHSNALAGSRKTIISYVSLQLLFTSFTRHTHVSIIEDIQTISLTVLAILAIFYFDFRVIAKPNVRNLLSSVFYSYSALSTIR